MNSTRPLNSSENPYRNMQPLDTVPYGVMSIPLELVGIIGSIVFLHELHHNVKNRTSATAMFANLCISTLLQTGITSPLQTYTFLTGAPNGLSRPDRLTLCKIVAFIYLLSVKAVILCQASIALNRMFSVMLVAKYPRFQSKSVVIALLAFPWIIGFFSHCFPLFGVGGAYGYSFRTNKCSYTRNEGSFMHFQRSFVTVLALCVIVASYAAVSVKIFYVQRRLLKIRPVHREDIVTVSSQHNVATSTNKAMSMGNPKALRQMRREIRAAKIALLSSSVFVACYLPTVLHSFISENDPRELLSPLGMSLLMVQSIGAVGIIFPASFPADEEERSFLLISGISVSPWLACILHGEFDSKLSQDLIKWLETNAFNHSSRSFRWDNYPHNDDASSMNRSAASHSAAKRLVRFL